MTAAERAAHVREVLETCARALQQAPDVPYLLYATGLVLGVRSHLQTLEEWQRWGTCAAALLCARDAQEPPAAGEEEAS